MIKLHRGNLRTFLVILGILFMKYGAETFNIGIAVFLAGLFLHLISKGFLYRNVELAIKGPYSFVRHPFYIANLLLDIGIILMSGYPLFILIYLPFYYIAYNSVILREEKELINIYGGIYKKYMEKIPRYFPKAAPYAKDWYKGFKWGNILREREISRLLRLISYPISFLVIRGVVKHGFIEQETAHILTGAGCVIVLLWTSYLVHNMVERERIFKDKNQDTVSLCFTIFIIISGTAFAAAKFLKIKSAIILLLLNSLFILLLALFISFIVITIISRNLGTKYK